jgi:DNA primase
VIIFEEGKDPADMIKENRDISDIFKNPTPFIDFIFQRILTTYDIKNIHDKPKIIQETKEFIFSLPEVIREDVAFKASQTFQIDKKHFFMSQKQNITPQITKNIDIAEASVIKTVYENRDLLNYLAEHLSIDMFSRHQKELQLLYEEEFDEVALISLVMNDSVQILNEQELKGQIIKIQIPFYMREKQKLNQSCSIEQKAHKIKMLNDKILNLRKGII